MSQYRYILRKLRKLGGSAEDDEVIDERLLQDWEAKKLAKEISGVELQQWRRLPDGNTRRIDLDEEHYCTISKALYAGSGVIVETNVRM